MGVVNTSPDSYFEPSTVSNVESALSLTRKHIKEGAHIIEVGGLSGGSSAKRVSGKEEMCRSLPVIEAIIAEFPQVTLTIDTFRSEVARAALSHGAHWINDVTAMTFDPAMVDVAMEFDATVVLMHLEGPGGHKGRKLNRAFYSDVVEEVKHFFRGRISDLTSKGMSNDRLIVDVGLGAGKRPAHDYELMARLREFSQLGCRQMGACSRKQLVEAISPVPPSERLGGSVLAAMWSVLNGCEFLRVHDVRAHAQAIDVWNGIAARILRDRPPVGKAEP